MRIREITLEFRDPEAFLDFYREKLGLPINAGKIQAGSTAIKTQAGERSHYYHFAFNISHNLVEESIFFLEEKGLEIIRLEGKKIVEFPNWNARSIYFFDSSGNVVEFIARKDLDNAGTGKFSPKNILSMSEIGVPCESVGPVFEKLSEKTSVRQYDGNLSTFCAAGDPEGLFIITHRDRDWFPTEKPSVFAPFEGVFEIDEKAYRIAFTDKDLRVQRA